MVEIGASVGLNGTNHRADVTKVQELLNSNRYRIPDGREILADGRPSPKTIETIMLFQRTVLHLKKPDGRIDPGGKTLQALIAGTTPTGSPHPLRAPAPGPAPKLLVPMRFPFRKRPQADYHFSLGCKHKRYFGAPRTGKNGNYRAHAGCDLIADVGTEILAMDNGTLVKFDYFYEGTNYLAVRHDNGLVVRYGEIASMAGGLTIDPGLEHTVKRGQTIAYVGRLNSGSSMLHLEVYAGTVEGCTLTMRGGGAFERRGDLVDPTDYLDQATFN